MSMYSSYEGALGEGSMFNAKVENFNEQVKAHNQAQDDAYKAVLLTQSGTVSSDKTKQKFTEGKDGVQDGSGLISTGLGIAANYNEMQGKTFASYLSDTKNTRLNTIGSTWAKIKAGKPLPKESVTPASVTSDGKITEATTSETTKPMTQPESSGASDPEPEPEPEALTSEDNLRESRPIGDGGPLDPAGSAVSKPATDIPSGTVEDAGKVVGSTGEAGAAATNAAAAATDVTETSGIVPSIIKGTLMKAGAGKLASDAAVTGVSEVAGKAISAFAGGEVLGKGIDNLANGKNFFGNDDTAQKWGDSFQMAGAAADIVGTAFPPLEVVGGALNLVGGVIDGIDDLFSDHHKTLKDAAPIPPPKHTAVKVSPAFGSLGLIASAPISAKSQIQGSGSF